MEEIQESLGFLACLEGELMLHSFQKTQQACSSQLPSLNGRGHMDLQVLPFFMSVHSLCVFLSLRLSFSAHLTLSPFPISPFFSSFPLLWLMLHELYFGVQNSIANLLC